jgi:hypothetical protein
MTSTATVLGLAIMSILGHAPADAAQFKIYGKFADKLTSSRNDPIVNVENGFFDGTVEIDDTNSTNGFNLTGWSVQVFSSTGRNILTFRSEYPDPQFETGSVSISNFNDSSLIKFDFAFNDRRFPQSSIGTNSLNLFLNKPNFIGNITPESYFDEFRKPYYVPELYAPYYAINIVDGYVKKVPEPLTIIGTLAAGAMGWSMKRRQKYQSN